MRKITSLAHGVYCPGQRAIGASDSSGAAVQGALLPPGGGLGVTTGIEMLSSAPLQPIETFARVARGLPFDDGKLSEALRARWPQPYSTLAYDRAFRFCTGRLSSIAARLRPTGPWRRVLAGGKRQPPGHPGGFRWRKNGRTLFAGVVAVVLKPRKGIAADNRQFFWCLPPGFLLPSARRQPPEPPAVRPFFSSCPAINGLFVQSRRWASRFKSST